MVENSDFSAALSSIISSDVIQCANVKNTTNRQWVRLVGVGYDLQLWVPDTRRPKPPVSIPYESFSSQWVRDIFDPWKDILFPGYDLFVSQSFLSSKSMVVIYAYSQIFNPPLDGSKDGPKVDVSLLKEIVVYQYPRVFHVFDVVEHGRYWYRSIIFSSDPDLCLHEMKGDHLHLDGRLALCCGDPRKKYQSAPSLVIRRDMKAKGDSCAVQTFIPTRLLAGIIPSCLLKLYKFWQKEDDSITGYMPANRTDQTISRSVLEIDLLMKGPVDDSGFCFSEADALVSRTFVAEGASYRNASEVEFEMHPDPSKPVMFLVSLMAVLSRYVPKRCEAPTGTVTKIRELVDFGGEPGKYVSVYFSPTLPLLPILIALLTQSYSKHFQGTLHALTRLLLRLDCLSNILAWTKSDPTVTPAQGISIDLIELPRLQLTFEKAVSSKGEVRYMCMEQSGMFLAGYDESLRFGSLLEGLPRAVLLANADHEYFVLMPAIAKPTLVRGAKTTVPATAVVTYTTLMAMNNSRWLANCGDGDSAYFIYPVHSSCCFLSSRSIASSLYLLVMRLMSRNYRDAYRLIESCACDRLLTAQERQIFDVIGTIKDNYHPDAHACRLKLFFVTFGCNDVMPYPFDVEKEYVAYTSRIRMVSSYCRLSPDEEIFIIGELPTVTRHAHVANRSRIILASFHVGGADPSMELQDAHSRTFRPVYPVLDISAAKPPSVDLDQLDTNKPTFKNILSKLSLSKYTRPEPCTGPEAISQLSQILDQEKNMGFFFIYDLLTEAHVMRILPDDPSSSIASVLFRFLSDDFISGLQGVILRVLETHPELVKKMPIYEDKRKLTDMLKGASILQTHIKNAAAVIQANLADVNVSRMLIDGPAHQPPTLVEAAPTLQESSDFFDGRSWLNPRVIDFACARRKLSSGMVPLKLRQLAAHYTLSEVAHLVDQPLQAIDLNTYIEQKTLVARGEAAVTSQSHLRVMDHPSSNSHIARTAVSRLEQDIADFARDENAGMIPVLVATFGADALSASGLDRALSSIANLIAALGRIRTKDIAIVQNGIAELLELCNGSGNASIGDIKAVAFSLQQKAGIEASLEFTHIAACTAASGPTGDLSMYNPTMISKGDSEGLVCTTMLLMMTANRISHATLASVQGRSLLKVLEQLRSLVNSADKQQEFDRLKKELLTQSDNLALTLAMRRNYSVPLAAGVYELDPRFLLFEYCHGLLLRPSQVLLVNKLLAEMAAGHSVCHQMIMGAGKTTVVGPLLALLLASATTLVVEVVPPALLDFSAGVLRERFSAAIRKPVFTFTFDRYTSVTPQLLAKLKTAQKLRAVVVAAPSSVKSFMLKFIEICHNLNRQKNLVREEKEKKAVQKRFSLRRLLGFGDEPAMAGKMTQQEVAQARSQLAICEQIFEILRASVEIMDEVDVLLHPLKSELNWPLGAKEPLDFTRSRAGNGLRWSIPSHLLDAIFSCCGMPILADIAESKAAVAILDELQGVIERGTATLQLQKSPHLALVSKNFYDQQMRPVLTRWLLLWLRARKLPSITDEEIIEFLEKGIASNEVIIRKVKAVLGDDHVKMLNLGHDWLQSYLPFILQKINRVHFGLLQPADIKQLEDDGVKIPTSRKLTAVPFIAKDVPSRASEFAHPDVLVGLTIMAFRYEGLREKDFVLVLRHLGDVMQEESGPYQNRPSCQRFEQWVLSAGKKIRGSKKREKSARRTVAVKEDDLITLKAEVDNNDTSIFAEIFSEEDDLIWPLQLVDLRDKEQFGVLYPLLCKLPHTVMYLLCELIFPEVLMHQNVKLSTCGQELGGDMLFGRRIGFSGTPSDILPLELGSCQYERGSDGRVVHYLTSPSVVRHVTLSPGWHAKSVLDFVATAQPPFLALIDTGALVTGMSNKAAARYLLEAGLTGVKGVVYLDEMDRQMVLLRKGFKVVKLAESGLAVTERFSFYDQVHTTGMDIKQAVDACAALTLGKDMVFRDYAQGAFRMRGIGKGQTICLFITPGIHFNYRTNP